MSDITKLLRAIALGTGAQKNKHDIIFNAAAARIEALKQALWEIAQQKLSDELDEHEREWADYHDGWDQVVKRARAALAQYRRADKMSETLKPCPFCGGKANLIQSRVAEDAMAAFVECKSCGAKTEIFEDAYAPTGQVVDAWNRRASPPQPDALKLAEEWVEKIIDGVVTQREALAAIRAAQHSAEPEEELGLRWLLPREVRAPRRLQQAWRDQRTGRTEWRDVPMEVEE